LLAESRPITGPVGIVAARESRERLSFAASPASSREIAGMGRLFFAFISQATLTDFGKTSEKA
jgi:hypothetical protein